MRSATPERRNLAAARVGHRSATSDEPSRELMATPLRAQKAGLASSATYMDPLDPSSRLRAVRLAMTLVTTSLLMAMASCGSPGELDARGATGEVGARGAAAVWTAAPNQSLEPGTSEFTVLVSRLGCNNGVTGEVLEPDVRLDAQRVVLTFAVEPNEPSAANCLGNDQVRFDVTLEPDFRSS